MLLSVIKFVEIKEMPWLLSKLQLAILVPYQLIAILHWNCVFKLVFSVQDEELDQWGVC